MMSSHFARGGSWTRELKNTINERWNMVSLGNCIGLKLITKQPSSMGTESAKEKNLVSPREVLKPCFSTDLECREEGGGRGGAWGPFPIGMKMSKPCIGGRVFRCVCVTHVYTRVGMLTEGIYAHKLNSRAEDDVSRSPRILCGGGTWWFDSTREVLVGGSLYSIPFPGL